MKIILTNQPSVLANWGNCFSGNPTINDVVQYVQSLWQLLRPNNFPHLSWSDSEPQVTRRFRMHLNAQSHTHGLTGRFIAEDDVGHLNPITGVVSLPGRTDITYFSDRVVPAMNIIFEFKKIKGSVKTLAKSYCTNGMYRFITGMYGSQSDAAFMVGLISNASVKSKHLIDLTSAIDDVGMKKILNSFTNDTGSSIAKPATIYPSCDFETRHSRSGLSNIVLGHFLLDH